MKLYGIKRPDSFFQKVMQCRGNVYYLDGLGQKRDMKQLAGQLLDSGGTVSVNGLNDIDILLDDSEDCIRMLNYAMQSNAC